MSSTDFKYADCLMKHHVRREGWLPACKFRLKDLRKGVSIEKARRLRYFTFCAEGAIDVLMLDVENVIRQSNDGWFDTVYFFGRSSESILATRRNIPGAVGFPGDFADVVLVNDHNDNDAIVEDVKEPAEQEDTKQTREAVNRLQVHRDFLKAFPFDVVNLDLEGYLFKPTDSIPGRLINAFRKIFEWQKRPLLGLKGKHEEISAFTLMFTTKVGPASFGDEFQTMLCDALKTNLDGDGSLKTILMDRTGTDDADTLSASQFEAFFKLATQKILARLLMDTDWYIDPSPGVTMYEFERTPPDGPDYRMLHLVMHVKRHKPSAEQRAPGVQSQSALAAYKAVVHQIFSTPEIVVTPNGIDGPSLQTDLDLIAARRNKYRDPD